MPQQLVLLFDGTGCSFSSKTNVEVLREALGFQLGKISETESVAAGTEIDRYQLSDNTKRLVIYQEGLGAPPLVKQKEPELAFSFTAIYNKFAYMLNLLPEAVEQLEGFGIIDNIKHGYKFLVNNYSSSDQVFLFGFSRGSYTLRLLISIIDHIGLLDANQYNSPEEIDLAIDELFNLYREELDPTDNPAFIKFKDKCHPSEKLIRFAGLFESVPGPLVEEVHKNARLGVSVEVFRHAVAADERRLEFSTELVIPAEGTDFEQSIFPGSHGDVGGGYALEERGLANCSLHWMVAEANKYGLGLDLESISQYQPDPLAVLHDSRAEEIAPGIPWSKVTHDCRRPIFQTTKESFHPSILARYGKLVKNDVSETTSVYMPSNVSKSLVATLNAFELFKRSSASGQTISEIDSIEPVCADELSDADEDEALDSHRPTVPSLVPPKKPRVTA